MFPLPDNFETNDGASAIPMGRGDNRGLSSPNGNSFGSPTVNNSSHPYGDASFCSPKVSSAFMQPPPMPKKPPALGGLRNAYYSGDSTRNQFMFDARRAVPINQEPYAETPKNNASETSRIVTPRTISPPSHQQQIQRQRPHVPSFHPIENIGDALPLDLGRDQSDFDLMDSSFDHLLQDPSASTNKSPSNDANMVPIAEYDDLDFDFEPHHVSFDNKSSHSFLSPISSVMASVRGAEKRKRDEKNRMARMKFPSTFTVRTEQLPMRSREDEIREVFKLENQGLLEEALSPSNKTKKIDAGSKSNVTKGSKSKLKSKTITKKGRKSPNAKFKLTADTTKFLPMHIRNYNRRLEEAAEFRRKYGHCSIPHDFPENQALARWAKRQRYQYKLYMEDLKNEAREASVLKKYRASASKDDPPKNRRSSMTAERVTALESLGFCWNAHISTWHTRFEELKEFIEENGHPNVNGKSKLATWVKCQRRQYCLKDLGKKSNMTAEREQLLNSVGFCWRVALPKNDNGSESDLTDEDDDGLEVFDV